MKIVATIVRLLLGLLFTVFGLNFFLHFLPMPPLQEGSPPALFMAATFPTGFMYVVGALQVAGGLLLLVGRFLNLGVTLLGPVVVNILLFHFLISHADYPMPVVVTVMYLIVLASRGDYVRTVFKA